MTTRTSAMMPRLRVGSQAKFDNAMVRGTTATVTNHRQNLTTHKLPGIGTYVIDTPKDANLTAREKCFRYQEIHRGVSRSKLRSLPDIPKRYDMKTLPVAKLREIRRVDKSTYEETGREVATPVVSENGSNDGSDRGRKQDPTWKLPSQEELVSRSPIGRMETAISGFGVRKNKLAANPKCSKHREFTYLSTNLALSEPEPVMVRATERELESQAEYRKQLTFYLNQMLNSENNTPVPDSKCQKSVSLDDEVNSCHREIPYDYVGHSSKHLDWESNLRLGDMLINTTPDLRKKLKLDEKSNKTKDIPGNTKKENKSKKQLSPPIDNNTMYKSGSCIDIRNASGNELKDSARNNSYFNSHVRNSHNSFHIVPTSTSMKRSNSFAAGQVADDNRRRATVTVTAGSTNKIEIVHHNEDGEEYDDDDDDSEDDEDADKWREVANMTVVESGVYDRYANVKLPPWDRKPTRGIEQKHLLPPHVSRNANNTNVLRGSVTISKNSSPSGAS